MIADIIMNLTLTDIHLYVIYIYTYIYTHICRDIEQIHLKFTQNILSTHSWMPPNSHGVSPMRSLSPEEKQQRRKVKDAPLDSRWSLKCFGFKGNKNWRLKLRNDNLTNGSWKDEMIIWKGLVCMCWKVFEYFLRSKGLCWTSERQGLEMFPLSLTRTGLCRAQKCKMHEYLSELIYIYINYRSRYRGYFHVSDIGSRYVYFTPACFVSYGS